MSRRRGRPAGASTKEYRHTDVYISACPECESTRRTQYHKTHEIESRVTRDDGMQEVIVQRKCMCLDCGTYRVDHCYECHRIRKTSKHSKRTRSAKSM